jgi:toxin-antitoxin system PIN domain toxin
MTYLPDINVWIASIYQLHIHHELARRWFDARTDDTIALCRVTQMGLLRLLTNTRVMAEDVFTAVRAWRLIEQLRQDDRIVFASEPLGLERSWREMTKYHIIGQNFWTDSYLAGFAQITGHTLVTFDRDFRRYRALPLQVLPE